MSIIRKIKQLMALARSSEGNEGRNAMSAARALAEKHRVNWQEVEQEAEIRQEVAEVVVGPFRGNAIQEWELTALSFIARIRPSLVCNANDTALRIVSRHALEANAGLELYRLVQWCVAHEAINCLRQSWPLREKPEDELFSRPEFAHAAFGVIGAWHDEWTSELERHAHRVRTRDLVLFVEKAHVAQATEQSKRNDPVVSPPSSARSKGEKPKGKEKSSKDTTETSSPPPGTSSSSESPKRPMTPQERSAKIRADILEASKRVQQENLRTLWMGLGYRYHRSHTGQWRMAKTILAN